MRLSTITFGAIMAATGVHAQTPKPKQPALQIPVDGISTSSGCYGSYGNMTMHKPISADKMSTAACNNACKADGFWLAAMHGGQCLCGYALPPKKDLVEDSECNQPCPAYPPEACGGIDSYSIYNVGIQLQINRYEPSSSSTTSGTGGSKTSAASPTPTDTSSSSNNGGNNNNHNNNNNNGGGGGGGTTVIQTSVPTETSKPEKSGPNVAGIAAGVVVGVFAAAAAIAGVFFYVRRKRNSEIEEEHRRNAAVNAFISGSKPSSSHGSISMTDSRLDPVMAHRRMSDGSIADNEDYSRRILRVTNA